MWIFDLFFQPDLKPLADIGRLLASQKYEYCAEYIKKACADKKCSRTLKKAINYKMSQSLKKPEHMHRYQLLCELYRLAFGTDSRYFKPKRYAECVEAAEAEDKPETFYTKKLKPYFE